MFDLVRKPDGGVSVEMFRALRDDLTLDEALDLLEIDTVDQSWRAADRRNSDAIAAIIAERNKANAGR